MNREIFATELEVGYGSRVVVGGLTFRLDATQGICIVGRNGSGKSTLLRTMMGLVPPISGRLKILGLDPHTEGVPQMIRSGVRFLGQGRRVFGEMGSVSHRRVLARLLGVPESPGLGTPYQAHTKVGSLSLGEQRMESLELLSAGTVELMLLDEPLAGLDRKNAARVLKWLSKCKQTGIGLVVVEHRVELVGELCENTIVVRGGKAQYVGPTADLPRADLGTSI